MSTRSSAAEVREHFARILDRLNTEFEPKTESDQALVEMMAVARWRQKRTCGYERAQKTQLEQPAGAFRNLPDRSRTLELLNRYESSANRMLMLALHQCKAVRTTGLADQKGKILDCEANLDFDLAQ